MHWLVQVLLQVLLGMLGPGGVLGPRLQVLELALVLAQVLTMVLRSKRHRPRRRRPRRQRSRWMRPRRQRSRLQRPRRLRSRRLRTFYRVHHSSSVRMLHPQFQRFP